MKRYIFLVCLVILFFPGGVLATGNISVTSLPAGASIYLDGADISHVTPYLITNKGAGMHTVQLSLAGYSTFSQSFIVADGETSSVSATLVVSTPAPTITSISPSEGYNSSTLYDVIVTGTGFSTSAGVVLTKSDETNITGTCSGSSTSITCSFPLSGKTAGTWNVVVTNPDGQTATRSSGFTVINQQNIPTLTSITPSSGQVNTTVSITALVGTNFGSGASIRLKRSGYNPIVGDVTSVNTAGTKIVGSFDLSNQAPGNYQVCVYNDASTYTCDLTFVISTMSSTNGTLNVKSAPSGSKVYVSDVYKGYTPLVLENITPGTYTVSVSRTGYREWSESVKVTAGNISYVSASLILISDVTTAATATATPLTTATTVKKSTLKVPTSWPSATPATESPMDSAVVVGAVALGIGFVVIRRR